MKLNRKNCCDNDHSSTESREDSRLFTGLDAKAWPMAKTFIVRWILFAVLWWGLSAGVVSQQPLIIFVVSVSAGLSTLLIPAQRVSVVGIIRFVPFFICQSVLGGMDVASRAFRPSMPLKTGFINYNLKLNHPTARVIFVWVVSLLPGTAGVQLADQYLRIHVLDRDLSHEQTLKNLEQRVSAIFRN